MAEPTSEFQPTSEPQNGGRLQRGVKAAMESPTVKGAFMRADSLREELVGEAKAYSAEAADAGRRTAVRQVDDIVTSLHAAADALDGRNDALAHTVGSAASRLEAMASHLADQNVEQLAQEACQFARRHPATFIGSAVALGFAIGRAAKARTPQPEYTSGYTGEYGYSGDAGASGDGREPGTRS